MKYVIIIFMFFGSFFQLNANASPYHPNYCFDEAKEFAALQKGASRLRHISNDTAISNDGRNIEFTVVSRTEIPRNPYQSRFEFVVKVFNPRDQYTSSMRLTAWPDCTSFTWK